MHKSPHIRMVELNSNEWTGHLKGVEEIRQSWKVLVGVLTGNRQLGRPRCRWNIWNGCRRNIPADCRMDSSDWGEGSVTGYVNTVTNLWGPHNWS